MFANDLPNRILAKAAVDYAEVEREAAYDAALKLVARTNENLARCIRHYRDKAGRLLTKLDEVTRAILADNLLLSEEKGEV